MGIISFLLLIKAITTEDLCQSLLNCSHFFFLFSILHLSQFLSFDYLLDLLTSSPFIKEIPCEDNPLGAKEDGKLLDSSFTATSSYAEFQPFNGRLNGPLAWCAEGTGAGQEYLQIHVPDAEAICAIALQGTGFGGGNEHVTQFYLQYSIDGSLWDTLADKDGNLKVKA